MIRIVKKDAPVYFKPAARDYNGEEIGIESYRKADTTQIDKNWRPEDYKNPFDSYICNTFLRPEHDAYERGFQACLEALEKLAGEKEQGK